MYREKFQMSMNDKINDVNDLGGKLKREPVKTIIALLILGACALAGIYLTGFFSQKGKQYASHQENNQIKTNRGQLAEVPGQSQNQKIVKLESENKVGKPQQSAADENGTKLAATGVGVAPSHITNPTLRKQYAKDAADAIARDNLVKQIKSKISSAMKLENHEIMSRELDLKVEGILRNAVPISQKANADGSYEVTLECQLEQ